METVVVEIVNFAFSPAELTIAPGTKVKFVNRDQVEHSAVADDGSFDTGMLGQDEEKEIAFEAEGTFGYYCNPHTGMKGKIVVKSPS